MKASVLRWRFFLIGIVLLLSLVGDLNLLNAAEWQWMVPTQLMDKRPGVAYLWIPPSCKRVRGLILADSNMLERIATENVVIRQAAEKAGLGIVYFAPKT